MGLFPLEAVQPHPAASASTAQAVDARMRHLHQFHARNGIQQGARRIVNAVGAAKITGIVVGHFGLHFFFQHGLDLVEPLFQKLGIVAHRV